MAPELDVVDELFCRLIHGKPVADLASRAAAERARAIVREVRAQNSEKEWKEFPTLGMMEWTISRGRGEEILCFATDNAGANLFKLRPVGNRYVVAGISDAKESCRK